MERFLNHSWNRMLNINRNPEELMKNGKKPPDKEYNDGMLIESLIQRFWLNAILLIIEAIFANFPACSIEINMHIVVTVHLWWIVLFLFFPECTIIEIQNLKEMPNALRVNDSGNMRNRIEICPKKSDIYSIIIDKTYNTWEMEPLHRL
jgi:hypothetical protein